MDALRIGAVHAILDFSAQAFLEELAGVVREEAVLVVASRLVVGLTGGAEKPPLGGDIWKDTALALPPDLAGKSYRHLFTGEWLPAENLGDIIRFSLAAIFSHFPVAVLERGPN